MDEFFLETKLAKRKEDNSLRELKIPPAGMIDFCSNDYLGVVKNRLIDSIQRTSIFASGSTGSRLLTGNSLFTEETENNIASFHDAEAALIFNSGFDANLGLLSSIAGKGDTIIYDQYVHASLRDGIRLSLAEGLSFRHNDPADLENKLKKAVGNKFVISESLFSMDGDFCPLVELVALSEKYGAHLVIDEAHSNGIIGEKGAGLVQLFEMQKRVFARIHTFGKACGVHGAAVLGSKVLRSFLINFARPFIFSTGLPPHTINAIQASYNILPTLNAERKQLDQLGRKLNNQGPIASPIRFIKTGDNTSARELASLLQSKNLDIRPILYPTVPKGGEGVRIVVHSFNTENELEILLKCL